MELAKIEKELSLCTHKLNLLRALGGRGKTKFLGDYVVNENRFLNKITDASSTKDQEKLAMQLISYWSKEKYESRFAGPGVGGGNLARHASLRDMDMGDFMSMTEGIENANSLLEFKQKIFPSHIGAKSIVTTTHYDAIKSKLVAVGLRLARLPRAVPDLYYPEACHEIDFLKMIARDYDPERLAVALLCHWKSTLDSSLAVHFSLIGIQVYNALPEMTDADFKVLIFDRLDREKTLSDFCRKVCPYPMFSTARITDDQRLTTAGKLAALGTRLVEEEYEEGD